jgi:hypothetical protein
MGWVIDATPRPLNPWEIPGTPCIGDWVGLRSGLTVVENITPTWTRSSDRPARSEPLYRLSYRDPQPVYKYKITGFKYMVEYMLKYEI